MNESELNCFDAMVRQLIAESARNPDHHFLAYLLAMVAQEFERTVRPKDRQKDRRLH